MAFIFLTLQIETLHRRTPLCENQMENKYQKRALFQDNQQNRRTYSFQGNVETLRVNFEKNHISFLPSLVSPLTKCVTPVYGAKMRTSRNLSYRHYLCFLEGEKESSLVVTQSAEGFSRRTKSSKRCGGTFQ